MPTSTTREPLPDMHPLAALIREEAARQRISLDEIARRSDVPKGTVFNWADPDRVMKQTPRPENLAKLAKGLGVALAVVKNAAAASAGYEVDPRPVGYGLDREADGLPDEDVQAIRNQIRALRRARGIE